MSAVKANRPESAAQEAGDEHSRHSVKLDEVLHDEERRDLVRLVDDPLGLGIAAPVVGVDDEAGDDGGAEHNREEEGREEEGPAEKVDAIAILIIKGSMTMPLRLARQRLRDEGKNHCLLVMRA